MSMDWDLVVIGGGITGAGIFNLAVRSGLKTLLLEAGDFASGTSSKSSKLVHGGLRYLSSGQIGLTRQSVKNRDRLLREAPGLVTPLQFALPIYDHSDQGRWMIKTGLTLYDFLSGKQGHHYLDRHAFLSQAPHIKQDGLRGGFIFGDAQTDDARLVLRLIFEAENLFPNTGQAKNYSHVSDISRDTNGWVRGLTYREHGTVHRVSCRHVVNATGAWSDKLHPLPQSKTKSHSAHRIRPLRGSHLVLPFWKFPVGQAISFPHPLDKRPLFLIPWEGVTLLGTTDVDHVDSIDEPRIMRDEQDYLLNGLKAYFPTWQVTTEDLISSFAGIRPVVSHGPKPPSQESRESETWYEKGLLSVTGGKLTTFRSMAEHILSNLAREVGEDGRAIEPKGSWKNLPTLLSFENEPSQTKRLRSRYGLGLDEKIWREPATNDRLGLERTPYAWRELEFALKHEKVSHLDDLLMRRTRIGIMMKQGGTALKSHLKTLFTNALGWDESTWDIEWERYLSMWQKDYAPFPVADSLNHRPTPPARRMEAS